MLEIKNKKLGKDNTGDDMNDEKMNAKSVSEPFWPLAAAAVGLAVAVFAGSMSINWWGNTLYRSALVTALVLIVVADIQILRDHYRKKVEGIPRSDERLNKVIVYSSTYSFRGGILFMIVLIFLHLFKVIAFDTVAALSASVFVMAGTYIGFHWYFERKGDIER